MLNLIRCVAICFVALFLSACTTTEATSGYEIKTVHYEFACSHEPSQTKIDRAVAKAVAKGVAEGVAKAIIKRHDVGVEENGNEETSAIPAEVDNMVKITKKLIGDCKKFIAEVRAEAQD